MINSFVFDTNALISAHLLRNSVSRLAYDLAFERGILVRSKETFNEFANTLIKPKFDKYISLEKRLKIIDEFELRSYLIRVSEEVKICSDPDDDKFLSLAICAKASFLISGDKALLEIKSCKSIPIVNASDFLKLI